MMTRAQLEVGKRVRYLPGHAHGDMNHKDCENGVITSWSKSADDQTTVFVLYDGKQTSQGTYLWDLVAL